MADKKSINNENDIHKVDEIARGLKVNNQNKIAMQRNNLQFEKKAFCSDDVKKHVSLLSKFEFILLIYFQCRKFLSLFLNTRGRTQGDNAQKSYYQVNSKLTSSIERL